MSSSFRLRKRLENSNVWAFGLSGKPIDEAQREAPLGGMEDHYVRPFGDCHPDFEAIPIGSSTGVKVCQRRSRPLVTTNLPPQSDRLDIPNDQQILQANRNLNGYHRSSTSLYNPTQPQPLQITNPQRFEDRRIPHEQLLLREDYLRLPTRYNSTGLETSHMPNPPSYGRMQEASPSGRMQEASPSGRMQEASPSGRMQEASPSGRWYQYGFSHTPEDYYGNSWCTRSCQPRPDLSIPPVKYDITRLVQPFDIWKREQTYILGGRPEYMGRVPVENVDQTRIV